MGRSAALRVLAFDGPRDGSQNRFPPTWSSRTGKVRNITGSTVTPSQPQGNAVTSAAILDFRTCDVDAVAASLGSDAPGLRLRLLERPVLKFGPTLVQLPWILGLQNNSTAAINNLRRLLSRRGELRDETQRIEAGLARHLRDRGSSVLANSVPPDDMREAGEIDVLAARNGRLFVFEVKSTFMRQSIRDACLHATTTLRKAGLQLRRKLAAVQAAFELDSAPRESLGVTAAPAPEMTHACNGRHVDRVPITSAS